MEYQTVFQATDEEFNLFLLIPIVFIPVGLGIVLYAGKYIKNNLQQKMMAIIFGLVFSIFALVMVNKSLPERYSKQNEFIDYFLYKEPKIIEGKIENIQKYIYRGDNWCSFTVNDILFRCWELRAEMYFYDASGLLKNGKEVRLSYLDERLHNPIVKFELKK